MSAFCRTVKPGQVIVTAMSLLRRLVVKRTGWIPRSTFFFRISMSLYVVWKIRYLWPRVMCLVLSHGNFFRVPMRHSNERSGQPRENGHYRGLVSEGCRQAWIKCMGLTRAGFSTCFTIIVSSSSERKPRNVW